MALKTLSAPIRDVSVKFERKKIGAEEFISLITSRTVSLSTSEPIRAALTSQDLSTDTKFSPSQSRVTLPLKRYQSEPVYTMNNNVIH